MLSFIVIGKSLGRYTNMYNTLAASAIVLLCADPFLLLQVGFQLSYLAVYGIVFLYKHIHLLLSPVTWLGKQVWSLTAVSVAAQLSTFPLGLFYFHQFPNYFLLSNLAVIPVSTVIIYGGIVLFFISPVHAIAHPAGFLLGKIVHLLNTIVLYVEHLPGSLLEGISVSIAETVLIYLSMFLFIYFLLNKSNRFIFLSGLAFSFVLLFRIHDTAKANRQCRFIVYDIPKISAIHFIEGRHGLLSADSVLVHNRNLEKMSILPY